MHVPSYGHMDCDRDFDQDLTEKDNEGAYWQTKLKDKIGWRDKFFSQFRELLPPTKIFFWKDLEKQEQQKSNCQGATDRVRYGCS